MCVGHDDNSAGIENQGQGLDYLGNNQRIENNWSVIYLLTLPTFAGVLFSLPFVCLLAG